MSARHTLLGLLAEGPAHGYLLRKRLREKLGQAWEINSGQVSHNLGRLEEEGLVRAVNGEEASRGRKRVVELTEAGTVELDRWFERDTAGVRVSSPEFLAKVNLGGPERCEASLQHITTYETECVKLLEELQDERDHVPIWPVLSAESLLKRCATICEMLQVEAHLQGAILTRETIAELKDSGAAWGASTAQSKAESVRKREKAREDIFRRMVKSRVESLPDERGTTDA
jgi:DNA-binding PadR family transcriptional regulator